ncbi:aminopeptidase N-like isoform X4 [Lycorma delicatula]|uniref:aminopeptidase N-like isoform X4 n=1 Tax=Lycorma delicatula TaxID=130591 RepID=UPI003F518E8D
MLKMPKIELYNKVKVIITENTNKIKLNAKNLKIASSGVWVKNITDKSQEILTILNVTLIPFNDFLIIKLQEVLITGQKYLINIQFSAALRESLKGYYRSSYVDRDTDRLKWLAITQFQSIFAREAFPCFDEPSMKATFTISLGHKKRLKAISNMPLVKTTPMEGKTDWVWDEFQKSVPMSTYLVAFMISEMEHKDTDKADGNVKFRIWARKDAIDQVEFVKKLGPKILSFYEKYFDIKFPLPKQDLVALPDLIHGAMENWGLVTFRIHEDLKTIVYCEGIKHGTEKEWNFLFSVYIKTNFAKEKLIILSALSCSREVWILNRLCLWEVKAGIISHFVCGQERII